MIELLRILEKVGLAIVLVGAIWVIVYMFMTWWVATRPPPKPGERSEDGK